MTRQGESKKGLLNCHCGQLGLNPTGEPLESPGECASHLSHGWTGKLGTCPLILIPCWSEVRGCPWGHRVPVGCSALGLHRLLRHWRKVSGRAAEPCGGFQGGAVSVPAVHRRLEPSQGYGRRCQQCLLQPAPCNAQTTKLLLRVYCY